MSKRSRRERLWLLAVFVLVSTLVTLHLGHRLPWPHKHGILGSLVEDVERGAISSTEHLAVLRDIKRIPPSRHLESPGHDVYDSPGDDDNLSSSSDYQPQSNDAMIENKKITTTIYDNNNNDRDNNTDNYNNNNNNNDNNNSNNDIKKENTNINYNNNNNDDKYINESNDKKKFVNTGAQTPHHLAPSPHTTLINSPSHKQRNLHIIKRHHQGEENEFDDRGTDKDRKHYNAITRTTNTTTNTYNNNNNNVYYNIKGKNSGSSFTNWTYIKVKGKRRRHSPFTTLLDSRYNKNSDKTNNNNNKGKDNNNNGNPDPHKRDRLEILTAITTILQQIENETLLPVDTSRPLVVVEGGLSAVKQHFPLVESAFHKYKMAASFRAVDDGGDKVPLDNKEKVTTTTTTPSSPDIGSWSVLMCLNTTDSTANGCVVSAIRAGTKPYQKVNVIPNLSIPARTACDTRQSDSHTPDNDDHTRHVSGKWYGGDLPCVILASPLSSSPPPPPSSSSSASSSSSSSSKPTSFRCHESSGSWIVLEEGEGEGTMDGIRGPGGKKRTNRFIPCGDEMMGRQHQEWWTENVVTGPSPNNRTVIIQVPLPPRLLTPKFSTEGIVWQVYMLVTSLSPLRAYLHPSGIVWEGMEAYINRKINPTTYVDGLSSLSKYLVEQNILEDLAAMLSSRVSVSKDIGKILTEFGMAEVEQRGVCLTSSDFCLRESDLVHLMDTRREHGASRNWLRLCPSTSKSCYPELSSLQKPVTRHSGHRVTPGFSHAPMPPFPQMFPSLVEAVESAFQGSEVGDERVDVYEDDVNFPLEQEQWEGDDVDIEPSNMFNTSYTQSPRPCDNDSASLQYLSAIHTHPRLILHPEFTPLTTDYYTHVSHDTLLISIRAVAKHCKAAALLEDRRHAMNRWVNFTLGVGENTAHVMVVEMDERLSGWTLNTYKIRIYRRENNQHLGNVDGMGVKHQVCGLSQHCSLPFSTTAPCGLQHLNKYQSWAQLVQQQIELKQCGLYEGQWMVPCANCSHSNSCNWKVAMWGSEACQEKQLSMESVHSCFKDRKILFVGDSTLRGISHYLMEKVNGSLQEWDKTHNIKVYTSLAGGDTTVGFAYYPQFWLPVHKRPSLGVALKKLIGRAAPLVNSSRTVLALGGVHWLGRHHIDVLMTTLASEGLTGIQVIVKGLGAGFHQPISSMHHLTLTDHEKLLVQNQAVLSYALTKGFQVVDTFNMTMARYTEFLQGKCACHFQRVARERMSIWSRLTHTASTSDTTQPRFHVEGDVGTAYSEMMINRMCGGGA